MTSTDGTRAPRLPREQRRQGNILGDVEVTDQMERLKHEAQQATAKVRAGIGVQMIDADHLIAIGDSDCPLIGSVKAGD